jgi:hypothetical protein
MTRAERDEARRKGRVRARWREVIGVMRGD